MLDASEVLPSRYKGSPRRWIGGGSAGSGMEKVVSATLTGSAAFHGACHFFGISGFRIAGRLGEESQASEKVILSKVSSIVFLPI